MHYDWIYASEGAGTNKLIIRMVGRFVMIISLQFPLQIPFNKKIKSVIFFSDNISKCWSCWHRLIRYMHQKNTLTEEGVIYGLNKYVWLLPLEN